jgi:hypothetical protein
MISNNLTFLPPFQLSSLVVEQVVLLQIPLAIRHLQVKPVQDISDPDRSSPGEEVTIFWGLVLDLPDGVCGVDLLTLLERIGWSYTDE